MDSHGNTDLSKSTRFSLLTAQHEREHLGDEDSQQRGEGIDGGVGEGGGFGVAQVINECQCRRIGRRTGQEATERDEVSLSKVPRPPGTTMYAHEYLTSITLRTKKYWNSTFSST